MRETTRRFGEVEVGETLPELRIAITPTLVVAGAIASRDFTPVHHDGAHARAQGLQGVIMNTMTTSGLVGRFVTDWTGPDAVLEALSLKLGAPNLPGDIMKLRGTVREKIAPGSISLEVMGTNSWGDHVTASVRVALPVGS
jgi:acyl dehydratase